MTCLLAGSQADAESMVALKDLVNQLDVEGVYTEEQFVKVCGGATAGNNTCCCVAVVVSSAHVVFCRGLIDCRRIGLAVQLHHERWHQRH
jgi:hypothetical protein